MSASIERWKMQAKRRNVVEAKLERHESGRYDTGNFWRGMVAAAGGSEFVVILSCRPCCGEGAEKHMRRVRGRRTGFDMKTTNLKRYFRDRSVKCKPSARCSAFQRKRTFGSIARAHKKVPALCESYLCPNEVEVACVKSFAGGQNSAKGLLNKSDKLLTYRSHLRAFGRISVALESGFVHAL